jgi:hypothetical protein
VPAGEAPPDADRGGTQCALVVDSGEVDAEPLHDVAER